MRAPRFNEAQFIGILREQEAGGKTVDICRKHGVSGATFYKWKSRYGGLDVSDARRLKTLEEENAKLKKLLAEAMLDNQAQRSRDATGRAAALTCGLRIPSRCTTEPDRLK